MKIAEILSLNVYQCAFEAQQSDHSSFFVSTDASSGISVVQIDRGYLLF